MSDADFSEPNPYLADLEEQARHKGTKPITAVNELTADVFESDEELDEFLADLYRFRHSDMA